MAETAVALVALVALLRLRFGLSEGNGPHQLSLMNRFRNFCEGNVSGATQAVLEQVAWAFCVSLRAESAEVPNVLKVLHNITPGGSSRCASAEELSVYSNLRFNSGRTYNNEEAFAQLQDWYALKKYRPGLNSHVIVVPLAHPNAPPNHIITAELLVASRCQSYTVSYAEAIMTVIRKD